ncbi:hypothetical protein [Cyanobium sp. LEGE 06113]|uniref:hypothetical protein n=1 Tax=Cyanobium sp. LEGE 06113 TaxID=1297573 RepID=UPI001881B66A|nr:hypothetical protein [Cyanobium sp. LEGE 06113]MBE9153592.1 hypothetical protein [Cyanobium sp. LEGE 06113]
MDEGTMEPNPSTDPSLCLPPGLVSGFRRAGSVLAGLATSALALALPAAANGGTLYSLTTRCLVGDEEQPCRIEAIGGQGVTVYRHIIDSTVTSIRLIDSPEGAQIWDHTAKAWTGLSALSMDFGNNELCFQSKDAASICTLNPNYFASLRAQFPDLQRDVIKATFDADGRIAAICYTREACDQGF